MLKRIFSLCLLLCICFSFCSCGLLIGGVASVINQKLEEEKENIKDSEEYETVVGTVQDFSESENKNGYEDIERVKSNSFKNVHISVRDDNIVLKTALPEEILMVRSDVGFDLMRDNERIGAFGSELSEDVSNGTKMLSKSFSNYGVEMLYSVELLPDNTYVHHCRYEYKNEYGDLRILHLTVNYRELDEYAVNKLCYVFSAEKRSSIPNMTSNKLSDSVIAGGARIGIFGNSFINSSRIGDSLRDMLEYDHYVEDVSIGYATVSKTYSIDENLLNNIGEGAYDAIFICGFYGAADATALETLVRFCGYSDTKLFIFPAHNESEAVVRSAVSKYGNAEFLDWKGEIDLLIDSGVSRSDFCINDQHQHSTPLAGYVGASMIYRTLFGKMPMADVYTAISQSKVDSKLGDYVNTGKIEMIDGSDIYTVR